MLLTESTWIVKTSFKKGYIKGESTLEKDHTEVSVAALITDIRIFVIVKDSTAVQPPAVYYRWCPDTNCYKQYSHDWACA